MFWFLIPFVLIIAWLLNSTCVNKTPHTKRVNSRPRKTKLRFKPTVTRLYVDEDSEIASDDYILDVTTEPLSTKPKKLSEKN